jgi:hypothetical protein
MSTKLTPYKLPTRSDLPGRVCGRSSEARFSRGGNSEQNTRRTCGFKGTYTPSKRTTPIPPSPQAYLSLNITALTSRSTLEKRRRTLLLPKKDHRHRRAPRPCPRRPSLRRPRPLELPQISVPLLPSHLRARPPRRTRRRLHRRQSTDKHSTLRKETLWSRTTRGRS